MINQCNSRQWCSLNSEVVKISVGKIVAKNPRRTGCSDKETNLHSLHYCRGRKCPPKEWCSMCQRLLSFTQKRGSVWNSSHNCNYHLIKFYSLPDTLDVSSVSCTYQSLVFIWIRIPESLVIMISMISLNIRHWFLFAVSAGTSTLLFLRWNGIKLIFLPELPKPHSSLYFSLRGLLLLDIFLFESVYCLCLPTKL